MLDSGEFFYSIAALFSLSAYVLSNMLWLRIFLVLAAIIYIISGISLGIASMVGWNSAYLAINLFHVIVLLLDKSTITLPEETRAIYRMYFSNMSTREFKKIITINPFQTLDNGKLIEDGEATNRLFIVLEGRVKIVKSNKTIALLEPGSLVGEMSFMSKEPASADAIVQAPLLYAFWTHDDLDKLCQKHCAIYNKFISTIGCDLVRKLKIKNESSSAIT